MAKKLFLDTNAILSLQKDILKSDFVISSVTLHELEHIKVSKNKDDETKYKARKAIHILDENTNMYDVVIPNDKTEKIIKKFKIESSPDNLIIACAYQYNLSSPIVFVSNDICCRVVARDIFKLQVESSKLSEEDFDEYKGYKEVVLTDVKMAHFYENLNENTYNLLINEYIIIKNIDNESVDYYKWDGEKHVPISYKPIDSCFSGKIKPRNEQQILAFDMLQSKNQTIKILTGKYGTGKDYLMISIALDLIRRGKYDKILWLRNTIEVKDSKPIGFLPGTMMEKLMPYAMIMADHLGGQEGLDSFISQGKIEIEHLGFVRGRDYKNTIIMCSEAENMTKEHVQLLIGRVGEGSTLWLNGDYKQTDSHVFSGNNGLTTSIDKLKGNDKFGFVKLLKTERSETAAMADLLD